MTWRSKHLSEKLLSCSRGLLYALIFLMPLFFLSYTIDAWEFNKQALFISLTSASALCWMSSMLVRKTITLRKGLINVLVFLPLTAYGISSYYSSAKYISIFGTTSQAYTSVITLLAGVVLFFVAANTLHSKQSHQFVHTTLLSSAFIAGAIGLVSLFGTNPFFFTTVKGFNTVGTVNALGVFLAIATVFSSGLWIAHKKEDALLHKGSLGIAEYALIIGLHAVTLVYLNILDYWMTWTVLAVGLGVLLTFVVFRAKDFKLSGRLWLIVLAFVFSIVSIFTLPAFPQKSVPSEVTLSVQEGQRITDAVLNSSSATYGTGPGTFSNGYAKHHGPSIVETNFWNTRFDKSSSLVGTLLPTTGYLGVIAWAVFLLSLAIMAIVQTVKPQSREEWLQTLVAFSPWLTIIVAAFLYHGNMTFMFLLFLFSGLLGSQVMRKELVYPVKKNPVPTLLFSGLFLAGSIFFLVGMFITGQRYVAEVAFSDAVKGDRTNAPIQEIVRDLDKASTLNRFDDRYYRSLAEAVMIQAGQILSKVSDTEQLSDPDAAQLQGLIAASINASVRSTRLSPQDSRNWFVRGMVYRQLIPAMGSKASQFAVHAHETMIPLEPLNPRLWNELGKTYLSAAENERTLSLAEDTGVAAQAKTNLDALLKKAESAFGKSIEVKSDYASAHFQLALAYERQGRLDDAIGKLESVAEYNPTDIGVSFQLGQLYLRRDQAGDTTKAREAFERTAGLSPSYSNARWFLATIYEQQGEIRKAIQQIEKVNELNPNNPLVQNRLRNLLRGDESNAQDQPLF